VAAEHVAMTRNAMDKKHLTNVERMADPNSAPDGMQVKWQTLLQAAGALKLWWQSASGKRFR